MLSLLGSLLGFGGSVIPGILDSFKKKQDQKYELKKLEVQAQINRENLEHQAKIQKEMGKQKLPFLYLLQQLQMILRFQKLFFVTLYFGFFQKSLEACEHTFESWNSKQWEDFSFECVKDGVTP